MISHLAEKITSTNGVWCMHYFAFSPEWIFLLKPKPRFPVSVAAEGCDGAAAVLCPHICWELCSMQSPSSCSTEAGLLPAAFRTEGSSQARKHDPSPSSLVPGWLVRQHLELLPQQMNQRTKRLHKETVPFTSWEQDTSEDLLCGCEHPSWEGLGLCAEGFLHLASSWG